MNTHLAISPSGIQTRWASFENPKGQKSGGGIENFGAKGRPFRNLAKDETVVLMECTGPGQINRIWITIQDRSPAALRTLILRCYWDGASKPAVEVPLGDFMCAGGGTVPFENELFSNPQGRSFNCYIPMPFRTAAKITLSNETGIDMPHLFYDVDYSIFDTPQEDLLYFHGWFNRNVPVPLETDYEILGRVTGKGRFLGTFMVVQANRLYEKAWWGEGEVKVYLDGDNELPTLVGTGTEDYIGTAWGQGKYIGRYQGCLIAEEEKKLWSFYRLHIPDPVYFDNDIRVTIQDIGGDSWQVVQELETKGVPLIPITTDDTPKTELKHLYRQNLPTPKEGWINFYRQDDFSSVAWFYLDKPFSELPPLPSHELLLKGLEPIRKPPKTDEVILVAER